MPLTTPGDQARSSVKRIWWMRRLVAIPLRRAARRIYLSPRRRDSGSGDFVNELAVAGMITTSRRYRGVDQRVMKARALEEVGLGDFMLAGGEVALALIEACVGLFCRASAVTTPPRQEEFYGRIAGISALYRRPNGRAARCRKCSFPGIMKRLKSGGRRNPKGLQGKEGRISGANARRVELAGKPMYNARLQELRP